MDKRHPQDAFVFGRVRVQLFDANGKPVVEDIVSKKALLRKMAQLIPQLKTRTQGPEKAGGGGGGGGGGDKKKKKAGKQQPTTGGGKKKK